MLPAGDRSGLSMEVCRMLYDEIAASWRKKKIRTAADIALEMNGNGAAFFYNSAKIENDSITNQ